VQDRSEREAQLFAWLAQIPPGRVVTYGQLARLIGMPRGARWVGSRLGRLPPGSTLPWHRVVNASGRSSLPLGADGSNRQLRRLAGEGVEVVDGRIALARCQWRPFADADDPQ
jgi:methylated-DNA-protein-cysteine methyltransferase-like protein